jgi:hypothetical protein
MQNDRFVTGGKYSAKLLGGGFRVLTDPSLFVQADFGNRPRSGQSQVTANLRDGLPFLVCYRKMILMSQAPFSF